MNVKSTFSMKERKTVGRHFIDFKLKDESFLYEIVMSYVQKLHFFPKLILLYIAVGKVYMVPMSFDL